MSLEICPASSTQNLAKTDRPAGWNTPAFNLANSIDIHQMKVYNLYCNLPIEVAYMVCMSKQLSIPLMDRAVLMGYNPGPNDFYRFFKENVTDKIDSEALTKALYDPKKGQPPIDPAVMMGALVLCAIVGYPLDLFAYHLKVDVAWQYALGITGPSARIPSYSALRSFNRRIIDNLLSEDVDLVNSVFNHLSIYYCIIAKVNTDIQRIDSALIESYAKQHTRFSLIYSCVSRLVHEISKKKSAVIPEQLQHFLNPEDFNCVTYHDKSTSDESKMDTLLKDASLAVNSFAQDYAHLKAFKILQRCLYEQTTVDDNGNRALRQKGDPVLKGQKADGSPNVGDAGTEEDPTVTRSGIMQTPVDPEATFNGKRGEHHCGYICTVTEARGPYGPILTGYTIRPNNTGDNKMAVDLVEKMPHATQEGAALVGDAGFSGDKLQDAVEATGRSLVTTNLTGRKTPVCFAKLEFGDDGIVTKCPGGHAPTSAKLDPKTGSCRCKFDCSACASCPYKNDCNPQEQKNAFVRSFTQKQKTRALSVLHRETSEFSAYSKFRNGVEAIFSLLRRAYDIDYMPVYGLARTTIRMGYNFIAVNVTKCYLRMMAMRKQAETA